MRLRVRLEQLRLGLFVFGTPPDEIREDLEEGTERSDGEHDDDWPGVRCEEIEEHDGRPEPKPGAPRAVQERMQRAAEAFRPGSHEPITDELRYRIVDEQAGKAPDRQRHEQQIRNAEVAIERANGREVPDAGGQQQREEQG